MCVQKKTSFLFVIWLRKMILMVSYQGIFKLVALGDNILKPPPNHIFARFVFFFHIVPLLFNEINDISHNFFTILW